MAKMTTRWENLTSLEYDERYYEEHKLEGLDYLAHGYWQQSYAQMISEATLQENFASPAVFDAGCACGSFLQAFRKTGLYHRLFGMDLSDHMVRLGRPHFGFSAEEIQTGSIAQVSQPDGAFTLVHCAQVLEHIPDVTIDSVLREFFRLLIPGGRAFLCLDAIRCGETKEQYMGDPTHCNVQPINYWTRKLSQAGLIFDVEAYDRFARSRFGPVEGLDESFFEHYPGWSVWTLIKPA